MEKLRTHKIVDGNNRTIADLWYEDGTYKVVINIEQNDVHVCSVQVSLNALEVWQELLS